MATIFKLTLVKTIDVETYRSMESADLFDCGTLDSLDWLGPTFTSECCDLLLVASSDSYNSSFGSGSESIPAWMSSSHCSLLSAFALHSFQPALLEPNRSSLHCMTPLALSSLHCSALLTPLTLSSPQCKTLLTPLALSTQSTLQDPTDPTNSLQSDPTLSLQSSLQGSTDPTVSLLSDPNPRTGTAYD